MLQKRGICAGLMPHRAGLQSFYSSPTKELEAVKQQPGDLLLSYLFRLVLMHDRVVTEQ